MNISVVAPNNLKDYEQFSQTVTEIVKENSLKIKNVIHSNSKGIDAFLKKWAKENKIPTKEVTIEWNNLTAKGAVVKEGKFGKYNSNAAKDKDKKIAEKIDCLIVIKSSQTKYSNSIIKLVEKANKQCIDHLMDDHKEYTYEF